MRTLAQRRDAILRAYLPSLNPVADLHIEDGVLTFTNRAVDADVASNPQEYRAQWSTFDNATHTARPVTSTSARTARFAVPAGLSPRDGAFIKVAVSAVHPAQPAWATPVDGYFRLRGGAWQLVGFERMPVQE